MRNLGKNHRAWRSWPVILAIVVVLAIGGFWAVHSWYTRNLGAVNSAATQTVPFTVVSGSTVHEIGLDLKKADLIRSSQAFDTYVRSRELFNQLQAGTYTLSQSMSTPQIVSKLVKGDVAVNLLAIPPGKTLKQIRQAFSQAGYNQA